MSSVARDVLSWQRLGPYLDQALELEAPAREGWLKRLFATQPAIASAVREMLDERDRLDARGFLVQSPAAHPNVDVMRPALEEFWHSQASPAPPANGVIVGNYRLLREVGSGGMSSVWLAERCDGHLRRQVALKLPFATARMLPMSDRFKRERDILATLNHPYIARLYDAGVDASGQPFLAMEYVEGTALTAHCDQERLPLNARLELFLQVLEAVQFAHTQLVLHRDLKPSNILVTAQGRVALLDFGIAKLLTEEGATDAPVTELAARALTPHYASPEQVAAKSLGTTSDVYSLGVILYELLTGQRPYRLERNTRGELEDAILTHDPLRPSQLTLNENLAWTRSMTMNRLARALRGDLETIMFKALMKEPSQRYSSVADLAQDVRNYLAGLPVTARAPSTWYRFSRFVTRHKLQVAAASIAIVAVVAGAGVAIWQARVAAQERDRAISLASRNAAVNEFMGALITEATDVHRPVSVSDLLDRGERLVLADKSGSREDRAAILAMIAARYGALDDATKATSLLDKALDLLSNTDDAGLRAQISCERASAMADLGNNQAAIQTIEHELKGLDSDPGDAAYCLLYRSFIAAKLSDAAGTLRYAQDGLARFHAAPRSTAVDEGLLLGAVGWGEYMNGRSAEADRYYKMAMQKYTELGRDRGPNALTVKNNWAIVIATSGAPKRALALYDDALDATPNPESNPFLNTNRGRSLESLGRYADARASFERGLRASLVSKDDWSQANSLLSLASISVRLHDSDAATKYLKQATDVLGDSLPPASAPLMRVDEIRGRLYLEAGDLKAARAEFERAIGRNANRSIAVDAWVGKIDTELQSGEPGAAVRDSRVALEEAEKLQGGLDYSERTGLALATLGQSLLAAGEKTEAHTTLLAAVDHLTHTVESDHPVLLRSRELVADR